MQVISLAMLTILEWSLQFLGIGSSNLWVRSLKSLGKGSFCQRLLQIIIRLNTLVDTIRVPKVRTSVNSYRLIQICKHPLTCLYMESTVSR